MAEKAPDRVEERVEDDVPAVVVADTPKRRKTVKRVITTITWVLFVIWFWIVWYPRDFDPLRIAEETTHITGPLRMDGTVDYAMRSMRIHRMG